ncbi:MAG: hypothetical protein LIO51_06920 [Clostridiales bacterium]|nr:hypothetical protein [Clostridiales bacterium]
MSIVVMIHASFLKFAPQKTVPAMGEGQRQAQNIGLVIIIIQSVRIARGTATEKIKFSVKFPCFSQIHGLGQLPQKEIHAAGVISDRRGAGEQNAGRLVVIHTASGVRFAGN